MPRYEALVGGNYDPTGRRIEEGDILDDLSKAEAKDLLAAGMIREAK